MQTAHKAAKASLTALPSAPVASSEAPRNDLLPAKRMVEFWLVMTGFYNHRWVSACGELPIDDTGAFTLTGKLWAQGLHGFTQAQIQRALSALMNRADDWPPVLSEFRALCLEIPSLDFVRADIGKRDHGFTRLVWQYLDHWMFTRADQRDADRQLRAAYDHARERRMCGDEFPDKPVLIAQDKPAPYVEPSPEDKAAIAKRAREALNA